MSGLITSGDTVNNFGKLLPAVYIENIYISDDDTDGAQLDVDLGVYVNAAENVDITTLISQLGDLQITWFWGWPFLYVEGQTPEDNSGYALRGLEYLLNNKRNIRDLINTMVDKFADDTIGYSFVTFSLSDIADDYLITYDDEGNRFIKFSYSSSTENTITMYSGGEWTWNDLLGTTMYQDNDMYLFAFATFDPVDTETSTNYWYAYADYYDDRFGRFLAIETGDIAYDAIVIDGAIARPEQVIWVDGDGNVYDGTPLQSLTSKYYSTEDLITHSEIVSSFEDLLGDYETAAESDDALQDIMDQISLVIETYKESADLLAQLNLIARVFPSKSSVTSVGALYIQYREKIVTANAVIETGTEVFKEVVTNIKVVEKIESSLSTTTPTYEDDLLLPMASDGVVAGTVGSRAYVDNDGTFISNLMMGVEQFFKNEIEASDDDDQWYTNYGFVFFDFDKALYETADMGAYFDMSGVFNLLGKTIANEYFFVKQAKFTRYDSSDDEILNIKTLFGDPDDSYVDFTAGKGETYWWNKEDRTSPAAYVYNDWGEECWAQSFLLLRNFELTRAEGFDGNRMMCFEFQDLHQMTESSADSKLIGGDYIEFYISCSDQTSKLVTELVAEYVAIYDSGGDGGLYNYYSEATDSSNFNEEDNRWTDVFATTQTALYDLDLAAAPWVLYPIYYCTFLALTTEDLDATSEAVIEEANRISATIHPVYGTVSGLEDFYTDFQALGDLMDAEMGDGVISTSSTKTKTFTAELTIDAEIIYDNENYICTTPAYIADEFVGGTAASRAGMAGIEYTEITDSDGSNVDGSTSFALDMDAGDASHDDYGYGYIKIWYDDAAYIDGTAPTSGDDVADYFSITAVGVTDRIGTATWYHLTAFTGILIRSSYLFDDTEYTLSSDFNGEWTDEDGKYFKDIEVSFTTKAS